MVLNGYDSSSFNAVQGSDEFMEYFHHPVCSFENRLSCHI